MKTKLSSELLIYSLKKRQQETRKANFPNQNVLGCKWTTATRRHGILQRKKLVSHHEFSERPETLTQKLSRCSSIHGEMVGFPKEMVVQIH